MNLKINTSLRGRGKWGDFLVAILPLSWCANILLNSNFILRMFEWQNESSLFTVRVHGKQWYWIYKFDLIDAIDILTVPKNIGNNRWVVGTPQELVVCESYLQAIQLRSKADWIKNYWKKKFEEDFKSFKILEVNSIQEYKAVDNPTDGFSIESWNSTISFVKNIRKFKNYFFKYELSFFNNFFNNFFNVIEQNKTNMFFSQNYKFFFNKFHNGIDVLNIFEFYDDNDLYTNIFYNYDELDDTWDVDNNIRHQVNYGPVRLIRTLLSQQFLNNNFELFKFEFYDNNNQISTKLPDNDNFWVLKQKRYKKKQLIKSYTTKDIEYMDFDSVRNIYKKHIIENLKLITDLDFKMDPYSLYKCIRGNRHRTESLPVHLYRRLLRTKRTLTLPAHVNMTVVTNSYDVVHSWFLPGLGIKMDCVPGRSTHHSLYLDNIGFYYGQCAEICGRYHHHMPIRICALPFEHFLVWWNIKGLPKLLRLKNSKNDIDSYYYFKYTW